jgi:hypothetical protein
MAGRKSRSTPTRRLFTLEEAERALPLVRRVVQDVVDQFGVLADLVNQRNAYAERGNHAAVEKYSNQAHVAAGRLNELIDEVHSIGCELKDWETGLIDFRAEHAGREIYLCWRLGESHIEHWHELHTGVAGRQPIASLDGPPSATNEPVGSGADA